AHRVQPQVSTPCGLGVCGYGQPGDGQCHGALDVVPHVGVTAGEPGDGAARLLAVYEVMGRVVDLLGSEYAGQVQSFGAGRCEHVHGCHQSAVIGLRTYPAPLLPEKGARRLPRLPATAGALSMSHTRSSW